MDALKNHLAENAGLLAPIGCLAGCYLAFKLFQSIWSGLRVFVLGKALGLSTDLKKLGEWAVVTGATDGIGKGYAQELARKGINVVLISRSPEKLNDVAKEIENKFKVKTKVIPIDFSGDASIYEKIKNELAGMDIGVLVNNVGMSLEHPNYYGEVEEQAIEKLLKVNMHSVAMLSRMVLPSMSEKRKGAIINISSASGLLPIALLAPYSASKAFVDFLSNALHQEYASRGVIIQCVLPFFVATKLSRIRRTSFFIPDPNSYARAALATVGLQQKTFGCMSHALQGFGYSLVPDWVALKISMMQMSAVRKLALKKKAKKQ